MEDEKQCSRITPAFKPDPVSTPAGISSYPTLTIILHPDDHSSETLLVWQAGEVAKQQITLKGNMALTVTVTITLIVIVTRTLTITVTLTLM